MEDASQNHIVQPIVHVGNLSAKTKPHEIQELFSEVVPVHKVCVKVKPDMSSAYAFVTLGSVKDCEKAVQELNFTTLHNKQMNITVYDQGNTYPADANIFVKNLPPTLNSKDLNDIFKMFGQIVSCKVASSPNGELKGYGYVQYRNAKAAKKAIANCKGVKIATYTVEVEPYRPDARNARGEKEAGAVPFTNCYMKNFPASMTEQGMRSLLEKYGEVTSIYFPVKEDGTPAGFACANFARPEDAKLAIKELHGNSIFTAEEMGCEEGLAPVPFYIQRAEVKKDREETLKRQLDAFSFDGQRSKCNLYVSNIPESFSSDEIKNIFLKFGKITSFKISCSGPDARKKYGYICYATPEDAAIAYEKIDGTFLDGNKLQISYYKTKCERSAVGGNGRANFLTGKPDGSSRRVMQMLFDKIAANAGTYKNNWCLFSAANEADFAKEVVALLSDFPTSHLFEMANNMTLLDEFIQRTISGMKSAKKPAVANN